MGLLQIFMVFRRVPNYMYGKQFLWVRRMAADRQNGVELVVVLQFKRGRR
jgi:hypothetical protein